MPNVEVVLTITSKIFVEAADKQAAIEAVWDEWWGGLRDKANALPGVVHAGATVELQTVDNVEKERAQNA